MAADDEWRQRLSNIIRSELKLRGMTYRDLAQKLNELGIDEREYTVRNKIARGRFSAVFFAQCLSVIGSDRIKLD